MCKSMKNKALFLYILFMFLVTGIAPLLSEIAVGIYLPSAIVFAGIVAIVLQKRIHHGKFVKMGFRLNRNALIGIGIGMLFTMAFVFINYGLPYYLGVERFTLNEESLSAAANLPPLDTVLILIVIGTIYFLAALFGEELAFRGYILPKLEDRYGNVKAIILCSVIFALWHLPVFYSAYTGGASESGWISLAMAIVRIGIIVAPICILYLTTRELYGVSLYHALIDVFYYFIFPNPDYGIASKYAIYHVIIMNNSAATAMQWGWPIFSIFLMLGLCRIVKK